jgi:hypothetical protein
LEFEPSAGNCANTVLQIGYVANRGVQLYSDIDLKSGGSNTVFGRNQRRWRTF